MLHRPVVLLVILSGLGPAFRFTNSGALAQGAPAAPPATVGSPSTAPSAQTILDTGNFWRCFIVRGSELARLESGELQPLEEMAPVVQVKVEGKYQIKINKAAKVHLTALPPPDWPNIAFDDGDWLRARGPFDWAYSPKAVLCLRGRFEVVDPAKAAPLTLALTFQGGVVVYVNGKELHRACTPAGPTPDCGELSRAASTAAEDYPREAYVTATGEPVILGPGAAEKFPEQFNKRLRRTSVNVPPTMLITGVNVLAIEVHRSPADQVMFLGKGASTIPGFLQFGGHGTSLWPRLAVVDVRLTAQSVTSAESAERRALRVWVADVLSRVHPSDGADPAEPVGTLRICGARNGVFSGQFVVSCNGGKRIGQFNLTVSDLDNGRGGTIPASSLQVRYAVLGDDGARPGEQAAFDGLEESTPPADATTRVQPLWLSVRVGRQAKAGHYRGSVTISQDNAPPIRVPVELEVADFLLPNSTDFVTHVGLIQSPESEALQYKVDMWSEEHWMRLDKAFELLGQVGNKEVYIPVMCKTHFGNEHGMVRWVRQADGSVKPDFTVAERYLDLAVKHLGKSPMVVLYCWEPANARGNFPAGEGDAYRRQDMPIRYTLLDPATGKLTETEGPAWGTAQCREFLKPLFEGMRQLLAKRGMADRMMVGLSGDYSPTKAALEDIAAAWGQPGAAGVKWVVHSHTWWSDLHGQPIGCLASVWGISGPRDPALPRDYYGNQRYYGWKNPSVVAFPRTGCGVHERVGFNSALALYRELAEGALTSVGRANAKPPGVGGFARMGADFWRVLPSRAGATSLVGRYPQTAWGSLNMNNGLTALLAPGKSGAISTVRLEMLREGLQEAEARVFMEKALTEPALRAKLGDELAQRCQELLDDRVRDYLRSMRRQDDDWLWFVASGWRDRTRGLYAMAAEVAHKLAPD